MPIKYGDTYDCGGFAYYYEPKMTNGTEDIVAGTLTVPANIVNIDVASSLPGIACSEEDANFYKYVHTLSTELEIRLGGKEKPQLKALRVWETDGGYTTVEWSDGTKTTVKAEDPEHADLFAAVCIAYTKRMLGSTTAVMDMIKTAKHNVEWPAKKKQIEHQKLKELKRKRAASIRAGREARVRAAMDEIRIQEEAQKRIDSEKEEN